MDADKKQAHVCEDCDGTGWTEAGWKAKPEGTDPFKGDCATCGGSGCACDCHVVRS